MTAKNKAIESFLLSQSMLHDELLWSYKSAPRRVYGKSTCDNRSINYCDKSVNTNETSLGQNHFTETISSTLYRCRHFVERN